MTADTTTLPQTIAFSPDEALMWQLDSDPSLRFHIVGVVGLDREPDRQELASRVERMTRVVPRLRHRVVASPIPGLRPHWELDPHFDLDYHFRVVAVPAGGGEAELLRLACLTRQDDFPPERPPWRMLLVTGLPDGGAALVVAMHHVVTDGIGAVRMAAALFDLESTGRPVGTGADLPAVEVRRRSSAARLLRGLTQEAEQLGSVSDAVRTVAKGARRPMDAVRVAADTVAAAARLADPLAAAGSSLPRNTSGAARFITLQAPVDGLKASAGVGGGRLNDAYLAVLLGGMRRYHERLGLPLRTLTVSMPVNVRRPDSQDVGGNSTLLKIVQFPADIVDPAARIAAVRKVATKEQTGGSHAASRATGHALSRLPGPVLRTALGTLADTIDVTTTNVPGAPVPLYLAGARTRSMLAFIPRGRAPLSAALLSYDGTAHIGLTVDPEAVQDVDALAACLQEELDAVLSLARPAAKRPRRTA